MKIIFKSRVNIFTKYESTKLNVNDYVYELKTMAKANQKFNIASGRRANREGQAVLAERATSKSRASDASESTLNAARLTTALETPRIQD